MKRYLCAVLFILGTLICVISVSYATPMQLGTEITISDKNIGNSPWYIGEDNEVEPGMNTGQYWDLEGMFLNNTILGIVGGFDFVKGYDGIESGDLFIDINGDAVYGDIHNGSTKGNKVVMDTYGYDYVFDIDFKHRKYDIFSIGQDTKTITSSLKVNQGSNPWRYHSGGTKIGSGKLNYEKKIKSDDIGFHGSFHNGFEVDLSMMLADMGATNPNDFIAHFTMECGNDNLMGRGSATATPEPSTMLLFSFGLIGLSHLLRRYHVK